MQESQTILQHHSARSAGVVCRRCKSKNVVMSRHRGIEDYIVSFLPLNICRCIECYNRFWVVESLFSNTKRIWVWGILIFVAVAAALLMLKMSEKNVSLNRTAELMPQFDQHETDQVHVTSSEPSNLTVNEVLSDTIAISINHDDGILEVATNQSDDSGILSNAKLQSKERSVAQKESLERLEQAVIEDQAALGSLLKIDMNYRVERWRDAWQSGLSDYYLEFYSENFQPSAGLSLDKWVKQRKKRVNTSKKINIELSNFDVSFEGDMKKTVMLFDQLYSSQTYSEKSRKQLIWVKEAGDWKIISETELSN